MKVPLNAIVDSLEIQTREDRAFLDRETGEVKIFAVEVLGRVEDGEADEEDGEDYREAERVLDNPERYLRLPTQFDIHEWQIMRDFADSAEAQLRDELLDALHGSGAFRHFKSALRRHRCVEQWFAYRKDAFRKIAVEWCEEHQIEFQR